MNGPIDDQSNKISPHFDLVNKLEWSKLSYSGAGHPSLHCCPICGGIRPSEYLKYDLHHDKRFLCGHHQICEYARFS